MTHSSKLTVKSVVLRSNVGEKPLDSNGPNTALFVGICS